MNYVDQVDRNRALDYAMHPCENDPDYPGWKEPIMQDFIDAMDAAGLKPIIVDEDTDLELKRCETNEEFLVRIMNYGCPHGALVQPFVIEALMRYARDVAAAPAFEGNAFVSGEAWKRVGVWLLGELEAKYGSSR